MPPSSQPPEVQDIEFQRHASDQLYFTRGIARGINPARIERIHEEIRFDDLVSDLTGRAGEFISCPFHGTDRTPSFRLYRNSNDAYCFGCGEGGRGYWEHIKFVKEFLSLTWVQALRWLEKKYELPPLPEQPVEDDEDEITTEVYFHDLEERFILHAAKEVSRTKDAALAEEYAYIYFAALQQEEGAVEAKKQQEYEEAARLHAKAAMKLAQVLGQEVVNEVLDEKEMNRR